MALHGRACLLLLLAGCHDFRGLTSEYGHSDLGCVGCGGVAPVAADLAVAGDFSQAADLRQGSQSQGADLSVTLDLSQPVDLSVPPPIVGHLTAIASVAQPQIDLTAQGAVDWVHWGYSAVPGPDRKAGVAAAIGAFSTILGSPILGFSNNIVRYSWSDGAGVNAKVSSTPTGVYVEGLNEGFVFSVPAGLHTQTLAVYVGGFHSRGELSASLSDNSASDYVDSSFSNSADGVAGIYDATYVLTFNAAAANQHLIIRWRAVSVINNSNGTGNVTLQAAALR
jgi:hypothetical protein